MKKALTKTQETHITILMFSGPDEEVKQVRLSKTILRSVALFAAVFLSYSAALSTGYMYLNKNHRTALARVEYLKEDNRDRALK